VQTLIWIKQAGHPTTAESARKRPFTWLIRKGAFGSKPAVDRLRAAQEHLEADLDAGRRLIERFTMPMLH
jgi:hypothetical protein